MINVDDFFEYLDINNLTKKFQGIETKISSALDHGDFDKWEKYFSLLPNIKNIEYNLDKDLITILSKDFNNDEKEKLKNLLLKFSPWRKGPFNLFGTIIDTEWRSDIKWNRIKDEITDLSGRNVLDVGCGSGYHALRMFGAGAKFVMGIDPYLLSVIQFNILKKYLDDINVWVLPIKLEELNRGIRFFDTVFSMGVLYHRRSPFDHLLELKSTLRSGGELVLETLIIDGKEGEVLVPSGRYAKMNNVWFIPSVLTIEKWLEKIGLKNIRMVDQTITTDQEQRKTDWMTWESLNDFLDPTDKSKTIEGYPAPKRAIFIAESN